MGAPTLLVGIGGTGSSIVQRVYDLATPEQREKLGFVIFDTDVNELRMIEEKTPQIKTIQTSSRMTVGEYLDVDEYARNHWFPVNRILNSKALTEGAGQVRAISRLALNTTIKQGRMYPLDEAIDKLYALNVEKNLQAPRIIITGSLCGGTGSGLVLPISLYIRNLMTTKLQQGAAIIRGFFLLPEVYDGVIKAQSERNNLRSNAYAAVREIDAFEMKADGLLPEQYKELHFFAPRAGSKQPEEYNGRPLDYCFLFDAQNINGQKLRDHESYRKHAALCIYGMAVAPTSIRSNSSEDNTIRELVEAEGRNRYAGAGTAILRYPTDDIKRYLALCWTKSSISDEWLIVDKKYNELVEENARRRRGGANIGNDDRGEHYIGMIDGDALERKSYAMAIREEAMQHDENGYAEIGSNWGKYVDELESYIVKRIDGQKKVIKEVTKKLNTATSGIDEAEDLKEAFKNLHRMLNTYQSASIKNAEIVVRNVIFSMFKDEKDYTNSEDSFRMEYWLHRDRKPDTFLHPNSIRYFLYNLKNELNLREGKKRKKVDEIEKYWREFDEKTFVYEVGKGKDGETVCNEDGFYDFHHLGADGLVDRALYMADIKNTTDELRGKFSAYKSKIDQYWVVYAEAEIFKAASSYVSSLCEAFHGFYNVLGMTVGNIDIRIRKMKGKYVYRPGEALRYVCANQECLEGLEKEVINRSSGFDTPAGLNKQIFNSMKLYALAEQKPAEESYFMETFNKSIVGFFEESVMGQYGSIVDMDIISAMEKEAKYTHPDEYLDSYGQQLYASKVIEGMENLAKPFIESPVGKEPRILRSCAYSPDLFDPVKADFPGRIQFVDKYLKDAGGEPSYTIDRNMILFYQAVYDIRAKDLSKFAPARNEETYSSPDGDYYKAYYELINQINPETGKSKAITPHIDKWWHIIDKLPDLDEKSQADQEKRIHSAFFWGVLAQFIRLGKDTQSKNVYCLDQNMFKKSENDEITQKLAYDTVKFEEKLIVSNNTPCDHLYEILDSFTIYPALVTAVLGQAKKETDSDLYDKKPLERSYLFDKISRFTIDEFDLSKVNNAEYEKKLKDTLDEVIAELTEESKKEKDNTILKDIEKLLYDLEGLKKSFSAEKTDKRSIFELPILMKASVPAEKYFEKNTKIMVAGMFEVIQEYIQRFVSEKEYPVEYCDLLLDQYYMLLKNIIRQGDDFPVRDLFHDSLFIHISGAIKSEIEDLGFRKEASVIENITHKLSKVEK